MGRIRKTVPRNAAKPAVEQKTQAERQCIAEDVVRVLREVGYECSNDRIAPTLRRDN